MGILWLPLKNNIELIHIVLEDGLSAEQLSLLLQQPLIVIFIELVPQLLSLFEHPVVFSFAQRLHPFQPCLQRHVLWTNDNMLQGRKRWGKTRINEFSHGGNRLSQNW